MLAALPAAPCSTRCAPSRSWSSCVSRARWQPKTSSLRTLKPARPSGACRVACGKWVNRQRAPLPARLDDVSEPCWAATTLPTPMRGLNTCGTSRSRLLSLLSRSSCDFRTGLTIQPTTRVTSRFRSGTKRKAGPIGRPSIRLQVTDRSGPSWQLISPPGRNATSASVSGTRRCASTKPPAGSSTTSGFALLCPSLRAASSLVGVHGRPVMASGR